MKDNGRNWSGQRDSSTRGQQVFWGCQSQRNGDFAQGLAVGGTREHEVRWTGRCPNPEECAFPEWAAGKTGSQGTTRLQPRQRAIIQSRGWLDWSSLIAKWRCQKVSRTGLGERETGNEIRDKNTVMWQWWPRKEPMIRGAYPVSGDWRKPACEAWRLYCQGPVRDAGRQGFSCGTQVTPGVSRTWPGPLLCGPLTLPRWLRWVRCTPLAGRKQLLSAPHNPRTSAVSGFSPGCCFMRGGTRCSLDVFTRHGTHEH